jgi:hypothetical protein
LVVSGCLVLLAAAALHLVAAYPKVSSGLAASNLETSLEPAMRTVFILVDGTGS